MRTAPAVFFAALCAGTITLQSCDQGTEPLPPTPQEPPEAVVAGNVLFFVDTLIWGGGESDPSGFILTDPNWLAGEPDFPYTRIYLKDSMLSSVVGSRIRITGVLDTLYAGGNVTPRRSFPWIETTALTTLVVPEYFPNQIGTQWTYEVFDPYMGTYFPMVVSITDTLRVSPALLLYRWTVDPDPICYLPYFSPEEFYVSVDNDTVQYYYYSDRPPLKSLRMPIPVAVGMQWYTGLFSGDSAHVEGLDSIETNDGTKLSAFRIYSIFEIPNQKDELTRWFTPYVGLVKFEGIKCYPCGDLKSWILTDFRIGQPDTAGFQ